MVTSVEVADYTHRKALATWYARGHADAGGYNGSCDAFADAYAAYGTVFDRGHRSYMPALASAFYKFIATGFVDLNMYELDEAYADNEVHDIQELLKPVSQQNVVIMGRVVNAGPLYDRMMADWDIALKIDHARFGEDKA